MLAAHVVGLRPEDMFHPDPHGGLGPVAALGLLGQRLAPLALAVDVAFQFPGTQLRLHLFGAIGRIRPHARTGIALHQQVIHRLAVVLSSIADVPAPHQLVLAVHIHVVLVAIMAFAVLFRPACIDVLLAALGGLVRPILGHLAVLDSLVLIARVVIARHRQTAD